jgi:glucose/mannose-6-phosphate isomerase
MTDSHYFADYLLAQQAHHRFVGRHLCVNLDYCRGRTSHPLIRITYFVYSISHVVVNVSEETLLDDLKLIHERDKSDALGVAEKQWQQLEQVFDLGSLDFPVENIVYAGMGGSALAARLSLTWPGYRLPFEICSQYHVPAYVSDKTLFIAASYSGNTEETLQAVQEAEQKGAHIVVIAGGGTLQKLASEKNYPFVLLPQAKQPRFCVLANLKALVTILEKAGLVQTADAEKTIVEAATFIKAELQSWLPVVATSKNPAKQLALDIVGKSPVVYAGPLLEPVAYKWKISFNENAKNVAWTGRLPEYNHNEFIGWSAQPVDKPYAVIDLRSTLEHERVQKRFEVGDRLLSGKRPAAHVVMAKGDTLLEQLLWTMVFGDFVSLYTAILNNVDPTPVDLVEKFKAEMGS